MKKTIDSTLICTATLLAGLVAGHAHAATLTWDGSTGNWNTPASWTPGGTVPVLSDGSDTAIINSGTVTYSGTSGDFYNNSVLTVGGTGTWTQSSVNWSRLGTGAGNTGVLNVNAGGTFDISPNVGNLYIGADGGSGDVNIDGGTGIFYNIEFGAPGGTLDVINGGTLTVTNQLALLNGGALTVGATANVNTFVFSNGSLNLVDGGAFGFGGNLVLVNGSQSLNVSGGTLNVGGEFKPQAGTTVVSGGIVNASLISFDGPGAETFDFAGGQMNISGNAFNGIFSAGADDYVNFTGTGGTLFFSTGTLTSANALLDGDLIRFNGLTDNIYFSVTETGGGVSIALVPEPASLVLIGLGAVAMLGRRRRD